MRPHRRQPTRIPCPWDSPGKNTGVACHFLLQCMKVKSQNEVAQSCPTLSDPMDFSLPGSYIHGIFQARVLEWGAIAFSTRILEWLAYPFSSGSSRPRNLTGVSRITGGFFNNLVIREAQYFWNIMLFPKTSCLFEFKHMSDNKLVYMCGRRKEWLQKFGTHCEAKG